MTTPSNAGPVENGRITAAEIYVERGILTSTIQIKCGSGASMGFGGYVLDANGGNLVTWVSRIMRVVRVDQWSKLVGQPIRVRCESALGPIVAIGNFMADDWFCPAEEFAEAAADAAE